MSMDGNRHSQRFRAGMDWMSGNLPQAVGFLRSHVPVIDQGLKKYEDLGLDKAMKTGKRVLKAGKRVRDDDDEWAEDLPDKDSLGGAVDTGRKVFRMMQDDYKRAQNFFHPAAI